MTWYELTLRRYDTNPATGAQDGGKTMSYLESDDEGVIASTMRRIADRLDPPQPPRPVYRSAADRREAASRRFLEKLAGYGEVLPPVRSQELHVEYLDECPDCIGDRHTHQPGRCALPPPWNGVSVLDTRRGTRAGACDQPGHGTTGCDCLPVVVDDPGDRMDVPDARLSTEGAKRVRRPGSRITPDGCGPEHTFTGSCAYASPERINPNA